MKPKLIGILLLAVVVLAAGGYSFYRENGRVTVLRGYLGGEKTGLFEDEEAARILGACFPERRPYPIDAMAIIKGGGNIHCITQQIPGQPRRM